MTDLNARILAVQLTHLCDSYDQDMGQCPCGFKFSTLSEWAAHVTEDMADAVIRELDHPDGWDREPGECLRGDQRVIARLNRVAE